MSELGQDRRGFAARQAARARLPVWLALLMPLMAIASVGGLTVASIFVLLTLHRTLHHAVLSELPVVLMVVGAFMGAVAPAPMLLNFLLARFAPLRRIFERNAKGVPGASYQASMRALWRIARILVPPALMLGLVGAVAPWAF
jgi:hypothetical protein